MRSRFLIFETDYSNLQDPLGKLMSTAMTTFFSMPSARSISLALQTFFHSEKRSSTKSNSKYQLSNHPRPRYQNSEMQILSTLGKVPGKTKLSMRLIQGGSQHMVRVDVVDMKRHVHHNFDYKVDGKYSKRRRSNVAVLIVGIVFMSSFLFYCLLFNHSFPTNPNRITNCFQLFFSIATLPTTFAQCVRLF